MPLIRADSIIPQYRTLFSPADGVMGVTANVQTFGSDLSGAISGTRFPAERWRAVLRFDNLTDPARGQMLAWLSRMTGGKRFYVHQWGYDAPTGSLAVENVITDPGFQGPFPNSWALGNTGTSSGTLNSVGGYWGYGYRVQSDDNGLNVKQELSAKVTEGRPYFWRMEVMVGSRTDANVVVRFNSDGGAGDEFSLLPAASSTVMNSGGVYMGMMMPTTGTAWIVMNTDNDRHSNMFWSNIQVSRCAIVAVASQTGDRLRVCELPANVAGLETGDMVEVVNPNSGQSSLHRLVFPADGRFVASDSAVLFITPPLRFSPFSGHPVNLYRPSCIMRLVEPGFTYPINNMDRSSFMVEAEEAFYSVG